jgi:MFS family permease
MTADSLTPEEQKAACRKVTLRLIPLLFICYVIAYIDRINVGFAKLHLQEVLGVSPEQFNSAYGLGAGLFFIGYFIFEVPSNLILQKVGARIWIARIMIVWGIVSMAFMFLKGVTMFYVMRFLLGAAEAGFFPGVLLYLTYWYPPAERARTIALFALGGVAAGVIGSPISGALLKLDNIGGLHMHGWQWLFFIEAIPAIVLGIIVFVYLPNSPKDSKWLSEKEKAFILSRLEASANPTVANHDFREILKSGRVWLLCLLYFLMNIGSYGFEMWAPTLVKALSGGKDDAIVGLINALPYLAAAVTMYYVSRSSDKTGERRGHISVSAICAAVGFVIAGTAQNPYLGMVGLIVAFAGLKATIAPFWALSTAFLSGTAAAGGIALINSVGNLGGYAGPHLVGYLKDQTGNSTAALILLGGSLLSMGILTYCLPKVGGTLAKQ